MRWTLRALCLVILFTAVLSIAAPRAFRETLDRIPGLEMGGSERSQNEDSAVAEREGGATTNPGNVDTQADDLDLRGIELSPIFEGVAQLSEQIAEVTDQDEVNLRDNLAAANQVFEDAKRVNEQGLRALKRPNRRVSPRMPHLILISVSGLAWEHLRMDTSGSATLHKIYNEGLRFPLFHSRRDRQIAWREFHTGLLEPNLGEPSSTLVDEIWKAGFLTAFVGDGSQSPPLEGNGETVYDYRFASDERTPLQQGKLTEVWSNGQKMELVPEADGTFPIADDVFAEQAAEYLVRHRGGRPLFLHLALQLDQAQSEQGALARLDARVSLMLQAVHQAGLQRQTVIMLTGLGEPMRAKGFPESASGQPTANSVPLVFYWPDRAVGKSVPVACSLCDLLPSVLDWGSSGTAERIDGRSLRPSAINRLRIEGRPLVWHGRFREDLTVVLRAPWLLVLNTPARLFDLVHDPDRTNELASELPSIVSDLKALAGQ